MASGEDLLQVQTAVDFDNSISSYEIHSYQPHNTTSFNHNDEIRIAIQQQDLYVHASKSSLHITGRLMKADDTGPAVKTHFVNNGICHLFSELRYELNGMEIDKNRNVGLTSLMKAFVSTSPSQQSLLENANFIGVNEKNKITSAAGYFDVNIPLSFLLGWAEDYNKIVLNAKHELILIRANTDDNAIIQNEAENYKVKITKIEWLVPHVRPSDEQKINLLKFISKNKPISMSFRSWEMMEYPVLPQTSKHVWVMKTSTNLERPRFILLGFQTGRKHSKITNASQFDTCSLRDVKIYLNSSSFPYSPLNINFQSNQYSIIYDMYANFQKNYYGKECEPLLSRNDFANFAPLFIIDCSKQSEAIKTSSVDLRLEIQTDVNVPADTAAFCLILFDRIIEYVPMTGVVKKL